MLGGLGPIAPQMLSLETDECTHSLAFSPSSSVMGTSECLRYLPAPAVRLHSYADLMKNSPSVATAGADCPSLKAMLCKMMQGMLQCETDFYPHSHFQPMLLV